jgi:DNA repair protein RadA
MSHVSDLQLEDLPGVQPHLINKLKQAGVNSVLDLAAYTPNELAGAGADGNAISADTETISELVLKAKKALADSGALVNEFSTAD